MKWKEPLIVFFILFGIIVAYTLLTLPQKSNEMHAPEEFKFDFSIGSYGLLDSGKGVRGYITTDITLNGSDNASIKMIMLSQKPMTTVYVVQNYASENEKKEITQIVNDELGAYNIMIQNIEAKDALQKQDSVIIIPTNAIPRIFDPDSFRSMAENNTVIFFGKPLDIALSESSSQLSLGNGMYDALGISVEQDGTLRSKTGTLEVHKAGRAQVISYGHGWLVLYDDARSTDYGTEIAGLILNQAWQKQRYETIFELENGPKTFFSQELTNNSYYIRLVTNVSGQNQTVQVIRDLGGVKSLAGTLKIDPLIKSRDLDYSFQLHDNLTYPATYDLSVIFLKDGTPEWAHAIKTVVMQTIAVEEGSLTPNITAGSYVVELIDQNKNIHAIAYTHLEKIYVELVRIEGRTHVFRIDVDGKPAISREAKLIINDDEELSVKTDEKGEAKVGLALAPGTHKFTVEIDGETGTTYYRKNGDESYLTYGVFVLALFFIGAVFVLKPKRKKRFMIKTYHRPVVRNKAIKIPNSTFMEIFHKTQAERAPSMPVTVSDLTIGIRKHVVYQGRSIFITDSNLFHILENLKNEGHLLSYNGYFLPVDMAENKSIEYWVMKRIISDQLIEKGMTVHPSQGGDFFILNRIVHIWHGQKPEVLIKLCKKADNVIVFPNEESKQGFVREVHKYGVEKMILSLELHHGRIYPQTIDEFLERTFNAV